MFIRHERSIKEFIQSYPIVSTLVIIHLALWLVINFLQLPFGIWLYQLGEGSNYGIEQGEYWRLITPIFLHADLMHALFNSFSLVLFGPALEQMLGRTKFIIGYLFAGIFGNLGTYLVEDLFYFHIGASGAIFGLFGIYIFMVLFRKHLIDQISSQIVTTIFVIGLIMTFFNPGINVSGHIFGFLGGVIIAPIVLAGANSYNPWAAVARRNRYRNDDDIQFDPNRWNKKRLPRSFSKNIGWIIFGVLVLLGLLSRLF
ncbi:rhomboid family intramembrane serine protease [Virgibacillus dokdonensis]|uniref:Rhomboid family intramembrane serine protease n=1 Tax=Virgibacillus dokdonensis TaxID=302167 RepID=A0A3E0WL24_9BACI|nr:rhomboid family intramembrane serine protease [Virgibacillus dokdonensis]RFA33660.1 rhomboid family intramembrane serine protease [Virgibacillus dokdonensis]